MKIEHYSNDPLTNEVYERLVKSMSEPGPYFDMNGNGISRFDSRGHLIWSIKDKNDPTELWSVSEVYLTRDNIMMVTTTFGTVYDRKVWSRTYKFDVNKI